MANYGKGRAPYVPWSEEEVAALRRHWLQADWRELTTAIPTRTRAAIWQYGTHVLGLKWSRTKVRWSHEENCVLWECYRTDSEEQITARLPGRTWVAIQRQACALGVPERRHPATRTNTRYIAPIVAQLRETRERRGLTRAALARRCGYAEGQILGWELGKTRPDLQALTAWAESLGFDLVLRSASEEVVRPRLPGSDGPYVSVDRPAARETLR